MAEKDGSRPNSAGAEKGRQIPQVSPPSASGIIPRMYIQMLLGLAGTNMSFVLLILGAILYFAVDIEKEYNALTAKLIVPIFIIVSNL